MRKADRRGAVRRAEGVADPCRDERLGGGDARPWRGDRDELELMRRRARERMERHGDRAGARAARIHRLRAAMGDRLAAELTGEPDGRGRPTGTGGKPMDTEAIGAVAAAIDGARHERRAKCGNPLPAESFAGSGALGSFHMDSWAEGDDCGSRGCIAGWTVAVLGDPKRAAAFGLNIGAYARQLLGLTELQAANLFTPATGTDDTGARDAARALRRLAADPDGDPWHDPEED